MSTEFIERIAVGLTSSLQQSKAQTNHGELTGWAEVAREHHGITVHGPGGQNNKEMAQFLPDGKVVYVWFHRVIPAYSTPRRQDAAVGLRIDLNEISLERPKEDHALHPEL